MYLISCTAKKQSLETSAKNMYISTWFKLALRYVGSQQYYILSAKYGLIAPEEIIQPYDKSLNAMSILERQKWSIEVFRKLTKLPKEPITIFAGNKYREFLVPLLLGDVWSVNVPLEGMGIGLQQKWFKENTT